MNRHTTQATNTRILNAGESRAEAVENERLRKENEKLTAELTRTKAALEVVGKAHALLELLSGSADSDAKRHR